MNRIILLFSFLLLISCKSSQECKEDIFKDYIWKNDLSGQAYDNLRFGDDDTLTFDQPIFSTTNQRYWFKFDDKCNGFYIIQEDPSYYFEIISYSNSNACLKNNSTVVNLHKL